MFERSWRISLSQLANGQFPDELSNLVADLQRLFVVTQREGILAALERKLCLLAQIMATKLCTG
ncbi:MAG: hypothetical protein CM15mP74_02740 [Halieaceae bacterium]|nr:MAG: hypothetical protein CM15mP74_02740 [Halieaceae bacterium]